MKKSCDFNKIFAGLIAIALAFSSGCGREESTASVAWQGDMRPASIDTENTADEDGAVVLRSETLSLPGQGGTVRHTAMAGGYIYLCAEDDGGKSSFYRIGQELEISSLGISYDEPVERFSADDSGNLYILNSDESGKPRMVCFDSRGGSRDFSLPAIADTGMVFFFLSMKNGFLVDTNEEILALDKDGKLIKSLGTYQGGTWIVRSGDDIAFIIYSGSIKSNAPAAMERPMRIDRVDGDFNISGSAELTGAYTSFFGGTEGELFTALEGNVYEYDYTSGVLIRSFNSTAASVLPEYYLGNGKYFAIDRGAPIILSAERDTGVKQLVLAGYNIDKRIEMAAQSFNSTNCGYVISLDDYARYDEFDNVGAGSVRLAADIISGHTPDIYDLSTVSVEQYAAKGLLAELTPFFEADSETGIDAIYDKLIEYTKCGGIYQLTPGFMLSVISGSSDTVSVPFTVDELIELADTYSPGAVLGGGISRAWFMQQMLMSMHEELYSPEDKTCRFDTEGFASVLSIAAALPEEAEPGHDNYGCAANGEQLLLTEWLGPMFVDFISFFHAIFGEDVCITGLPSGEGHGAAIQPQLPLGMSAASENKDGVWAFFRFLLSENMQRDYFGRWFFPAEKNALDGFIEEGISSYIEAPASFVLHHGGELTGSLDGNAARAAAYALFDSVDSAAVYDSEIYDIIMDSCGALWNGDKTPEDTAKLIQSRVSIYLSEQYG